MDLGGDSFTLVAIRHPKLIKVALPSHLHITSERSIADNWSFHSAKASSLPGVVPKLSFFARNLLSSSHAYCELQATYSDDDQSGYSAGPSAASTASSTRSEARALPAPLTDKDTEDKGKEDKGMERIEGKGMEDNQYESAGRGHEGQGTRAPSASLAGGLGPQTGGVKAMASTALGSLPPAGRPADPNWDAPAMQKKMKQLRAGV